MTEAFVDGALGALDLQRRSVVRALLRVPALRGVLARRDIRVPALLSLHALAAFAVALLAPSLSLVLGPLVLGVPHVAADVRYLILRRRLPRWWRAALGGFAGAMLLLRALYESRVLYVSPLMAEHVLGSCWLLLGALGGAALHGRRWRGLAVISAVLGLSGLALTFPRAFHGVLVHAHNLVAIGIWLWFFRRKLRYAWLPVTLMLGLGGWLASGAWLEFTLRHGLLSLFGLHLFEATDWLAPGIAGSNAIALTVSFAFLQSVHYALWLIGIPQEDARSEASPGFRMAYRALRREFGRTGLLVVIGLTLLVMLGGAFSAVSARNLYLSLATFHTWLELAAVAFFLASGTFQLRAAAA
jgi:hypothetical protein